MLFLSSPINPFSDLIARTADGEAEEAKGRIPLGGRLVYVETEAVCLRAWIGSGMRKESAVVLLVPAAAADDPCPDRTEEGRAMATMATMM